MTEFPDLLKHYAFDLPDELIAQEPAPQREASRLLVVRRNPSRGLPVFEDLLLSDLPELCEKELPQSLWIRNLSRVMPARFYAQRASGSRHEIVLLEELETERGVWKALIRKQARLDFPEILKVEDENVIIRDREHVDLRELKRPLLEFLARFGEMPLPPYIKKRDAGRDHERYQSVWASRDPSKNLSVAAPTASLHFTEELLRKLQAQAQVDFADIYLHVGLGTFEPLRVERLSEHKLHSERLEVDFKDLEKIRSHSKGKRLALGTTALRTVESLPETTEKLRGEYYSWQKSTNENRLLGRTEIFIKGGHRFRFADALFTNFHLPESTLFVLVAAFAGSLNLAREAYGHAIAKKYRFFSYGDASLWI